LDRYDLTVIGGGLVGLATAYQILRRRPGMRLAVVEKEADLALHQSGRNSGVVHSGLYYPPGSLKARLCREGKALLERFAAEHNIPYRRCGKLIVAVDETELAALNRLLDRGLANGVEGLREIGPEEILEFEPHAIGMRALHSPGTGVIDFRRVAHALGEQIQAGGGEILLNRRVEAITSHGRLRVLITDRESLVTGGVVTCAGLQSDRVAAMTERLHEQRIIPFRGSYYRLTPGARGLVRGLIYPVPDPALPFLGPHLTKRIDGEVWVGPSAVLALAREGKRPWAMSPRDVATTLTYPGFRKLARAHWREGLGEIQRDLVKSALVRASRRYLPDLRGDQLLPGPFGVRAQAVRRDGTLLDDFSLAESDGVIQVRNAPSPAATACLAIGAVLAERIITNIATG
jgi:(S)-2-hydroxyglutarate dehydrogenase